MIDNPQNVFEELQNDVATKLMQTSPFDSIHFPDGNTFRVLTEDEGDIQFEFDSMIAAIGLSLVVHSPKGTIDQPDIPGPLITKLGFDVWVSEAPVLNRTAGVGTGVRLVKAMTIVLGALHGFQPTSIGSPVYAAGFDTHRERIYAGDDDRLGKLIASRICHFIAPQVAAEITS